MKFIAIALGALFAVTAIPVQAAPVPVMKVMGADFYSQCANPVSTEVVAICTAYVAGVADEMQYEGNVCLNPRATSVSLLPYILNWPDGREMAPASAPAKKAYIPTDEECARLFNAEMPERLRRFMILTILTACRPQAAVDLAPGQRTRAAGTLDLNPSDRSQNKKYRALVRAPRTLATFLNAWEKLGLGPYGDHYCGYATMDGVKTAIER